MALNVKESKAFECPSPPTQSLRQKMFYCNIKRAHYWRRREVVTWNRLFLFFENYRVTLTLPHHARVRGTQSKMEPPPPASAGRWSSISPRMGNESKATLPKLSFALGSEYSDMGEPREENNWTDTLSSLFSDVDVAVAGLQTPSIRWRVTQRHHLLYENQWQFSRHCTSNKKAGSRQQVARGQSWDSWPKLVKGMFHTR